MSVPNSTAMSAFSTSSSMEDASDEVPMLALIFILSPLPMATGLTLRTAPVQTVISPEATLSLMDTALVFSLWAIRLNSLVILPFFAFSILVIVSGRKLAKMKNYMYSLVIACILCVGFPFGTVLGIFTIIVLSRETVRAAYGRTR